MQRQPPPPPPRRKGPLTRAFDDDGGDVVKKSSVVSPPVHRKSLNPFLAASDGDNATVASGYSSSMMQESRGEISILAQKATERNYAGGNNLNLDPLKPSIYSNERYKEMTDTPEGNMIYHKLHFSDPWMVATIVVHIVVFSLLLAMSRRHISQGATAGFTLMMLTVVILIILGRWKVKKIKRLTHFNEGILHPEDETDEVPAAAINLFSWASILLGVSLAIFASVTAGNFDDGENGDIYFSNEAVLQVLRFASIILLCFHRIIRPANRADPLRTILELEVVSVCWDAIDGSTFYDLLGNEDSDLNTSADNAARLLMAIWYLSVGVRLAMMFLVHHAPKDVVIPEFVMKPPLEMSPSPTVDRTMQSLRVRAAIILVMALSELYAIFLRLGLWFTVGLSSVQQEMTIKNFLFLGCVISAYIMWTNSELREWNRADYFGIYLPSRIRQLEFFRWSFVISYVLLGIMMSTFLIDVTQDSYKWTANIASDFVLAFIFFYYYKFSYIRREHQESRSSWLAWTDMGSWVQRLQGYVIFPGRDAAILGGLLSINMVCARIPALYYHANEFESGDTDNKWSYDNAMLMVQLTIAPIFFYAMYWSISLMLFRKEFTASPGNYNAIHDPMIDMVATSIMIEGAIDVISAAAFMTLAQSDLPADIDSLILTCALMEIWNACQSFALQAVLSGGVDDTPVDLVRWKAKLRMFRVPIDACTLVLRLILWIKYKQSSVSVFLVKNMYNLMHSTALIERARGIKLYPKGTLFTQFVSPQEWYGMDQNEWREATSETIAAQARAGRRI